MCIIVDANVRDLVFGDSRTPASDLLLKNIDNRFHRLVVGGKLRDELMQSRPFQLWLLQARLAQQVREINDDAIDSENKEVEGIDLCKSDDEHVIALARVSGARLLYTDDSDLQDDFRNPVLISKPRGRIYTTLRHQDIRKTHRDLLSRQDLCACNDCGK